MRVRRKPSFRLFLLILCAFTVSGLLRGQAEEAIGKNALRGLKKRAENA